LVNQADIESLDVLKGVAATAIYGSRGSNGVIHGGYGITEGMGRVRGGAVGFIFPCLETVQKIVSHLGLLSKIQKLLNKETVVIVTVDHRKGVMRYLMAIIKKAG